MTPDDIRAKMEKLSSFILDAEDKVRAGKMADLSGMDREVAVICNKAVSLPPDQARDIQPLMAEMIGNLERLSTALKDYKEDLKK